MAIFRSPEIVSTETTSKSRRRNAEEVHRVSDGGIEETTSDSGSGGSRVSSDMGGTKQKRKLSEDDGGRTTRSGKRRIDGVKREKEVQELGNSGEDEAGKGIPDSEEELVESLPCKEKMSSFREDEEELIAGENGDNGKRKENDGQLVEEEGLVSNADRENNVESRSESKIENNSGDNVVSNEGEGHGMYWCKGAFRSKAWFIESVKKKKRKERHNKKQDTDFAHRKFPTNNRDREHWENSVPSLQELCLWCLANNADKLVSLDYVPDHLRHRLGQLLCDSQRMNLRFLRLLVQGSPTEVCFTDCSWLKENWLKECFQNFDPRELRVLQLDSSGRSLSHHFLRAILARSANSLPALTTFSVRGAYLLSGIQLNSLVSSAPALRSLNLTECSLLTSSSIDTLANSLGSVLKELYLDQCRSINFMLTLPALKKLEQLEVLSVAGNNNVCDDFIREFISFRGYNMKELILAHCIFLTDSSVKIIAEKCPSLRAIDLSNLLKLTDSSLGYLANGCQAIKRLKLRRNRFSDECIAAFLQNSGQYLEELKLYSVKKVGCQTALSIARHSRILRCLNLSYCPDVTENALSLIVDSCRSLRVLKLFGWNQITENFIFDLSNPQVKLIGLPLLLEPEEL